MLRQNGRVVGYVKDDIAFLNNNYTPDIPRHDMRAGDIDAVNDICENEVPDTESPTAELLRFSHAPSAVKVRQTVLDELGKKLRERTNAISALREAKETLDGVVWSIAPYDYAMFMVGQEVPPEDEEWHGICPRARSQAHEWLHQRGRVKSRITRFEEEVEEIQRNITAISATMRQADEIKALWNCPVAREDLASLVSRHPHLTMPILERRRPGQRRPERRVVDDDDDEAPGSDLPEYETLACPLTAEAKRAIAELANSRDVHRYQNHVKTSIHHLGLSVAGINDSVRTRHEYLQRLAEKRAESNDPDSQEKSQREIDLETHSATLGEEVLRLTAEAEAALRDLIDRQIELEDEKAALAETVSYFQTIPEQAPRQRRRTRTEANADDSNMDEGDTVDDLPPPPDHSVIDVLRQHRAEKTHAYQRQPAYQRYALNNDYAAFKKLWHDAAHGDTEVPLPSAKRWFDNAGNPVMPAMRRQPGNTKSESGAQGADDSDEDIVIAGEVRDYRCPLSMQLFENPVSNNVCSHTYEKQWIVDMLQKAPMKRAQCPVAGCSIVRTCSGIPRVFQLTITAGTGA
ncbi:zinc-finger of the MIZ type in Nse subunit-domain-containing protein [Colletotrichum cereale]|nr:zinc-finger of the MIZ type in Nse subunit-domain-containing protein [Colletotrichum cereale]